MNLINKALAAAENDDLASDWRKEPAQYAPVIRELVARVAKLETQLAAAQQGVQDNDSECREKVAKALGFDSLSSYAWSYLLKQIESLVGCEEELLELKRAAHPDHQGLELHPNDVIRLAGEVGLNVYRGDGWPDEPLIAKLVKFAAQAKHGEPKQ